MGLTKWVVNLKNKNTMIKSPNGLFLLKTDFNSESDWRYDNCYKFIYSLSGSMTYQTRRSDLSLLENQFILVNPHDEHKQLVADKKKFLIELDPFFLNTLARTLSPIHHDIQFASFIQQYPQLMKWVQFVVEYVQLEDDSPDSMEVFLEHSFTQLALMLVKNAVGTQTQDVNINTYKTIHPQLYKTIQAMKENFQHSWTLSEMAEISHLSKFQFAHYFKEVIGVSPYSWLQIYRVIQSQLMMKNTNRSILEIALLCGFSSISIYNQLFKRLYGLTPSSFRNMVTK